MISADALRTAAVTVADSERCLPAPLSQALLWCLHRFDVAGIPYQATGSLAGWFHGSSHVPEDLDLDVEDASLARFAAALEAEAACPSKSAATHWAAGTAAAAAGAIVRPGTAAPAEAIATGDRDRGTDVATGASLPLDVAGVNFHIWHPLGPYEDDEWRITSFFAFEVWGVEVELTGVKGCFIKTGGAGVSSDVEQVVNLGEAQTVLWSGRAVKVQPLKALLEYKQLLPSRRADVAELSRLL